MSDDQPLQRFLCRACRARVETVFVDLGRMPLANAYPRPSDTDDEPRHRLRARVCERCWLVQLDHDVPPEYIFVDYAYFSSYSQSWVAHAQQFAREAAASWALGPQSLVVEIASNDGYLLKHFVEMAIPVLGIEPARNVAEVARRAGVETDTRFFGRETAEGLASSGRRADLLVGNNVLAHVPDVQDFAQGLAAMLADQGIISLEFPHLLRLIEGVQFDTIYHEHYSYLSLLAVERFLEDAGLRVFDVTELPTHGGSLRVLAQHENGRRKETAGLHAVRSAERKASLDRRDTYEGFTAKVEACRASIRRFLDDVRAEGRQVVGYGAAAKGNTLLNFCGVSADQLPYVVDRSTYKQGRLLPGTRIPIRDPDVVEQTRPDYLLILPWNLRDEIMSQMNHVRSWGGRFVTAVPLVEIFR